MKYTQTFWKLFDLLFISDRKQFLISKYSKQVQSCIFHKELKYTLRVINILTYLFSLKWKEGICSNVQRTTRKRNVNLKWGTLLNIILLLTCKVAKILTSFDTEHIDKHCCSYKKLAQMCFFKKRKKKMTVPN